MKWAATWLDMIVPLLSVLTPLVGVPLTVITFYLRSLREHQFTWHAEQLRRLDAVESAVRELRELVREFERDYATKEEWLRECMQARQTLNRLTETTVRLETIRAEATRDRDVRAGSTFDDVGENAAASSGAAGERD